LLAAALWNGIRVFRAQDGTQVGADTGYGGPSFSIDFHRSSKLVSTSFDGMVRLYQVSGTDLNQIAKQTAPGGKKPFAARFSPDGTSIAVGYTDSPRVDVLSGSTLSYLYSANTRDAKNSSMRVIAWSADGRRLYAGGSYQVSGTSLIRAWTEAGRGTFTDLPVAEDGNWIEDIAPLKTGGIVYAAGGRVGAFDANGHKILEQRGALANFKDIQNEFKVSPDGMLVQLAFKPFGMSLAKFDLSERQLTLDPETDANLAAPVTEAPGLVLLDWRTTRPTLNGQQLALQHLEASKAVAIEPDGKFFVLGSDWFLRRFQRQGGDAIFRTRIPGASLGVNVSGDGRLAVAALFDGTVRWYRLFDLKELLAVFLHADKKRWVLWSPSGYYDASPGAEDLIGWHVNRGKDEAADFYSVSRFRAAFYRPDVVAKVLEVADEGTALRLADQEAGRKTQAVGVAKVLPPVVEILAPGDGAGVSTPEVRVRFSVRTAADAPVIGLLARVNGQAVTLPAATGGNPGEVRELAIPVPLQDSDIMLFAENRHGVSVPAVLRHVARGADGWGVRSQAQALRTRSGCEPVPGSSLEAAVPG